MLDLELSRDMDRITQLQDGILDLLTQSSTVIAALTSNAHRVRTHPDLPIELDATTARRDKAAGDLVPGEPDGTAMNGSRGPIELPPAEYDALKKDLLAGFMAKASEVSLLIDSSPADVLPASETERAQQREQRDERLRVMEGEMRTANAEYKVAVQTADALLTEVRDALDRVLADHLPGYRPELRAGAAEGIDLMEGDVLRADSGSAEGDDVMMA